MSRSSRASEKGVIMVDRVPVSLFLFLLLAVLLSFFLGAAMHHWYVARKEYKASPGA